MTRPRMQAIGVCLAVLVVGNSGCAPKLLKPNENDRLRAEVRDLTAKVDALTLQKVQLEQQMVALSKQASMQAGTDPAIAIVTPRVAQLRLGSASHYQDADGQATDGPESDRSCLARVYVEPQDGLGRFLQIVGTVDLSVFVLQASGESTLIGKAKFDLMAVRDAWRGGVMGSHYTFEIPLAATDWKCSGEVTAKMEFVDAITGRAFAAQRELHKSR